MAEPDEHHYVLAGAAEDRELRRLELVQADFDIYSQARLTALGLSPGASCLEAGIGAGSMARWMKSVVGPEGRVVGVDLSDRYFHLSEPAGVEVVQGDIHEVDFPEGSFDIIHARCFLMHVPRTIDVLARFFRWLKPGGCVVLCDWDFSYRHRANAAGQFYNDAVADVTAFVANLGGNTEIGMQLPYLLADTGFVDIDAAGAFPLVLPWNNQAEFLPLSVEVARPAIRMDGTRPQEYEAFLASLPDSMQTGHVLVMSWARRPTDT